MSRNIRNDRSNLWSVDRQNVRVFNWREELENWSENLEMNPYVQTVVDNLHAACNPDDPHYFPLSHFRTYLTDEPEALKGFLYECVAMRWMWGNVRLDFVRGLMDLVDLDTEFPTFVGSPLNLTIRQFLEQHLTPEEKDAVDLMPPLTRANNIRVTYTPAHRRRVVEMEVEEDSELAGRPSRNASWPAGADQEDEDSEDEDEDEEESEATLEPRDDLPPFLLRFLREKSPKRSSSDDIVRIRPSTQNGLYAVIFSDNDAKLKREIYLPLQGVRRYVSAVLRSVNRDDDPFLSVQVEPPAAPSVLFETRKLTAEIRDLIYDHLELAFDSWPSTV